jgi:molybdate transport system ATP-binding protein
VLSTHRAQDIPRHATHLCRIGGGRILARQRVTKLPVESVARRRAGARREASDKRADAHTLITLHRATVWRAGVAVVKKVSLQIRGGDCWVVHGANGSGKSSFIQLLYGDLGPALGGSIVRAGIHSGEPLELFKRRVGLVAPELQALHPRYLDANEVVASGRHASIGLNGALPSAERVAIRRSLRSVGAAKLEQRAIRTLSYGQLRRVLFARALAHEPDMLLLDEPYAGIDPATRASLRTLVDRKLQSGVTVVMATHHRDEWPAATSHELELDRSRVVYCGPVRA